MATDSARTTLADYGALIKRRRVYFLSLIPGTILLSVFLAYILPATYRASATILLEPSSIPTELVKTTVTDYADQQIELVQRRVMKNEQLREIVAKLDPYPKLKLPANEKARMISGDTQIQRVDPVTLEPLKESEAFSIHYSNPNPEIAAAVAEELANLFLNYNRKTRTERAAGTYEFLSVQAKELEKSIRAIEQKQADFKQVHGSALPEEQRRNQDMLDRTQKDLDGLEDQIRMAEQRDSVLSMQLNQTSPTLVGAVQDWRTQLAQMKADLSVAEQKYTEDHPDIKRLRRAIAELTAQMGSGANAKVMTPDNPEYMRIAGDLQANRTQLSALRSMAARDRAQIQGFGQRLQLAPNVERDYLQLQRDHEIAQGQYEDVQKKLREAEYTKALEIDDRGERFTMIRGPNAPDTPFSPNRVGIILLGFVLGAGLAFGMAAFADSSDPTVRSASDLIDIVGISTVGSVPVIQNPEDRRLRNRRWMTVAAAYALAIVIVATTVFLSVRRTELEAARVDAKQQLQQ